MLVFTSSGLPREVKQGKSGLMVVMHDDNQVTFQSTTPCEVRSVNIDPASDRWHLVVAVPPEMATAFENGLSHIVEFFRSNTKGMANRPLSSFVWSILEYRSGMHLLKLSANRDYNLCPIAVDLQGSECLPPKMGDRVRFRGTIGIVLCAGTDLRPIVNLIDMQVTERDLPAMKQTPKPYLAG